MKLVCSLALSMMVLLTPARLASGADDYGRDINSPSANDPNLSSRSQEKELTPEQAADMKKQQEKAAADRDWMARGVQDYRNRNGSSSDESSGNSFYERLRSNKDLAKLAGIAVPEDDDSNASKALRTGVSSSGAPTLSLRTDPSEKKAPGSSTFAGLKPLIQPMGFINKALPPFVQPPPLPSSSDANIDLMDSPGMTAAAKNPLLNQSVADLKFDISTLDPLPDSKISNGPAFGKGQLPVSTNADRLRMQPMAPTSKEKADASAISVNPVKVELPPDLQPAKPIPFSPIRQPIADTHDIFFR